MLVLCLNALTSFRVPQDKAKMSRMITYKPSMILPCTCIQQQSSFSSLLLRTHSKFNYNITHLQKVHSHMSTMLSLHFMTSLLSSSMTQFGCNIYRKVLVNARTGLLKLFMHPSCLKSYHRLASHLNVFKRQGL